MFPPKEFRPWTIALHIHIKQLGAAPAGAQHPGRTRELRAQLLPQRPRQKHREYQDARLPSPTPPRREGEGGEGKKATPPPHAQAQTLEPLLQSKRPTYPVSHL